MQKYIPEENKINKILVCTKEIKRTKPYTRGTYCKPNIVFVLCSFCINYCSCYFRFIFSIILFFQESSLGIHIFSLCKYMCSFQNSTSINRFGLVLLYVSRVYGT